MMDSQRLTVAALIFDLQRALRALELDIWALDKACREASPGTKYDPSSWRYQTNLDLARRRYNADLKRIRMLVERLFRTKQQIGNDEEDE